MKVLVSFKQDLIEFQSYFSPSRSIIDSITITTAVGGLGMDLISTIEFLSKLLTACLAASNSGFAALRSLSASSAIAYASIFLTFTIFASSDATFSTSLAILESFSTSIRACNISSFFAFNCGCKTSILILKSAILILVSLSF